MDMSRPENRSQWLELASRLNHEVGPFIGGRRVDSRSHETYTKFDPATGSARAELAVGGADDVDAAVSSARAAFEDGRWSGLSVHRRSEILHRLADLIAANTDELALCETVDVGKPIGDAVNVDLGMVPALIRRDSASADKVCGRVYPSDPRSLCLTRREPHGVVAGIVGWNFPLALAVVKVVPALAAGNTMVLKPSELSPLSALRLGELALEAGVPEGVLNVVPGLGETVGAALAGHMDVDMLSFTGSSATGRKLMVSAGTSNMKKLVLECGGKSPSIVFDDFPDLDAVAEAVAGSVFWNQGQVCTAGTRLLVQEGVHDQLVERVAARAAAMRPGDPLDPATALGPLVSRPQLDKVMGYIDAGVRDGVEPLVGGGLALQESGGYFVEATVFDGVESGMKIAQEEIFGPVLSVIPFADTTDAARIANDTIYGLSATVWTRDLSRGHHMIKQVRAASISIRATASPSEGAPIYGLPSEPHRQSGLGVEGGVEGIMAFTELRSAQIFIE